MKIILSQTFVKNAQELPPVIKKKLLKQEKFFLISPFHNSLNTEKLEPKERQYWSFRIDLNYRVVFRFIDSYTVLFVAVGPHTWIYRINF